jgi:D-xylulose reductase
MTFAGWPPNGHGTLTKYFKLPADYCYKIPKEGALGLDGAVLIEPLAVAVHTSRQVGVSPGSQIVVFGAGTIGLLCAAVAKEFGASKIVIVDLNATKLAFAEKFVNGEKGGDVLRTYQPDSALTSEQNAQQIVKLHDLNGGATASLEDGLAGADIVIDATGAQPCIQQGIFSLRTGGTFIQTGMGKRIIEFPISTVGERELTVKGCFRYGPGDYKLAIGLASEGKIPSLKSLVTKVLPFEQATEAWETTRRGEGMKTLIKGVQD